MLSRELQARLDSLANTSESRFDSVYMDMMVKSHLATQQLRDETATNFTDVALREWAGSQLAAIQAHIDQARVMRDTLRSNR